MKEEFHRDRPDMIPVFVIIPEGQRPTTNEPGDDDVVANGDPWSDWNYRCGRTIGYCGDHAMLSAFIAAIMESA